MGQFGKRPESFRLVNAPCPVRQKFTFVQFPRNKIPPFRVLLSGRAIAGKEIVASRRYIMRQVATLLKFAKETADPKMAAALIEKAERLKAQVDDTMPPPDWSLRAPDVEPSPN